MTSISSTRPGVPVVAPARAPAAPHTVGGAPVSAVLDPVRLVKQHKWALMVAAVVGGVVGAALYLVLRWYAPSYRSSMLYEASPPITGVGRGESTQVDDKELERFIATESRRMVSEPVLRQAIQNNEVRTRTDWIKQFEKQGAPDESEAYRELSRIAGARGITGTMYMSLDVSAPKPADAQTLAMAIHEAYFTALANSTRTKSTDQTDQLSKTLKGIRDEVNRLEKANRDLFVSQGIETTEQQLDSGLIELTQALDKYSQAQETLTRAKVEQESLQKAATSGGGIQYTDTQREMAERAPLVNSLKEEVARLRAGEAAMAQTGKGENHRDRIELRARIDATQEQIDIALKEALGKIFAADVDQAARAVQQNEAIVRESKGRVDELAKKRGLKAVALLEVRDNERRLELLRNEEREKNSSLVEVQMIEQLKSSERIGRVRRVQAARIPDSMAFPRWEVMIPLGIFGALGLTMGFLVLRELMDQRVRGPSDIGLIPRLRMLGIVPDASEDPTRPASVEMAFKEAPTGAISEAFRQIRAPIAKRMAHAGHKTVLVMAGAPASGATSTVANLAMLSAATDQRVLMIDANLRRPALHKVFKLAEGPGLGDALTKKTTLDQAVQQTVHPNLWLLAAGSGPTRTVPERLATDSMTQLLHEAAGKFDLVIIDVAPAVVGGDGVGLANRVDAVVLVVRALAEKRGFIARLRDQLSDTRAEFLGVVVNGVRGTAGGYLKKNIRTAFEYQTNGQD